MWLCNYYLAVPNRSGFVAIHSGFGNEEAVEAGSLEFVLDYFQWDTLQEES